MKRLFVTGTDTGVGKTSVSVGLLRAAVDVGLTAAAFKPAESGCVDRGELGLKPADAMRLREAAGSWQRLDAVCPYRFEAAVAPGVAAESKRVVIDLDWLVEHVQGTSADLVLVEGAGGWLVPLGREAMIADLAVALRDPVLVVARCGLGTINHTLLTIESIRVRGLSVAGVVLCDATGTADASATAENGRQIERASGVAVLGVLPHVASNSIEALGLAAASSLRLASLFP